MKEISASRLPILSFVLFLAIFVMVGCEKIELNSDWRDREIRIDGISRDWLGALTYIEEPDISVGLLNDENFIYICLIAEEQYIRAQVMRQGLILWFDPYGGKKKTFGIRFPIGMRERGMPMRMSEDELDPEKLRGPFRKSMRELEILRPGKDKKERMLIAKAKGINVRMDAASGMLVYEIKVPLIRSAQHPYAIGGKPGKTVGIGFVSPKINMKMMGRRMGGGMPGVGGRSGMGRGTRMPKSLKVWLTTKLAFKNSR